MMTQTIDIGSSDIMAKLDLYIVINTIMDEF